MVSVLLNFNVLQLNKRIPFFIFIIGVSFNSSEKYFFWIILFVLEIIIGKDKLFLFNVNKNCNDEYLNPDFISLKQILFP